MPNPLTTFNPADITADVTMIADCDGDIYDRLPNTNGGWQRREPDGKGGTFRLETIINVYGPVTRIDHKPTHTGTQPYGSDHPGEPCNAACDERGGNA